MIATISIAAMAFVCRAYADNTPAVIPNADNPFSLEVSAGYNFATKALAEDCPKINTVGITLTGIYKLDENSSFTVNLSCASGSKKESWLDIDNYGLYTGTDEYTIDTYSLTMGYRYTAHLNEKITGFAGANIGIASLRGKNEGSVNGEPLSISASAVGLAYGLEIGASYAVTPKVNIFLAAQLTGHTAKPDYKLMGYPIAKGKDALDIGLRAGVHFSF